MNFEDKNLKLLLFVVTLLVCLTSFDINHRYDRYHGPKDSSLGLQCLFFGGLIWGIGMLIFSALSRKDGVIAEGQGCLTGIAGILCVIGALMAGFGLIMFGL